MQRASDCGSQNSAVNDLDLAHLLADTADVLTAPWVSAPPPFRAKFDGSPVTPVDEAVEAALVAIVARERPEDGFLGEEVGQARGTVGMGSRRWIVDGVDGTAAFIRNRPEWATLIGLEAEGRFEVGIVTAPGLDARWWARRGEGAWERRGRGAPRRLGVSSVSDLAAARVGIWPPPEDLEGPRAAAAKRLRERTPDVWAIRESRGITGDRPSAGSGYSNAGLLVAAGALDAVVLFGGSQWDHAAVVAIVQAAGGRYTDLQGDARIDTDGGIYTNGPLHEAIVATVAL